MVQPDRPNLQIRQANWLHPEDKNLEVDIREFQETDKKS